MTNKTRNSLIMSNVVVVGGVEDVVVDVSGVIWKQWDIVRTRLNLFTNYNLIVVVDPLPLALSAIAMDPERAPWKGFLPHQCFGMDSNYPVKMFVPSHYHPRNSARVVMKDGGVEDVDVLPNVKR